jgi:hypothetical protein
LEHLELERFGLFYLFTFLPFLYQALQRLIGILRTCELTDQLLTGSSWLHIFWTTFATPRHYVKVGYYK